MTTVNVAYQGSVAIFDARDATQTTGYGTVRDLTQHIPPVMLSGEARQSPCLLLTTAYALRITVVGPLLTIRDTGTIVLAGGAVPDVTIDLSAITLGGLIQAIAYLTGQRVTATLTGDTSTRSAIALVDQDTSSNGSSITTLTSWQSGTWRLLYPIAVQQTRLRARVDALLLNLDIRTASCDWLTIWGEVLGIDQLSSETCEQYRRRLLTARLHTRVNNLSLELLLKDGLGLESTVTENIGSTMAWAGAYAAITPVKRWRGGTVSAATWAPADYGGFLVTMTTLGGYSAADVSAIVDTYKAAGTSYTLSIGGFGPIGVAMLDFGNTNNTVNLDLF